MLRALTRTQLAVDVSIAGAMLLIFGLTGGIDIPRLLVTLGMSIALALRRLSPGIALSIAWLTALLQVAASVSPQASNLAILAVLYATSAYGGQALRWVGFASTFVGAAVITVSQTAPGIINAVSTNGLSVSGIFASRGFLAGAVAILVSSLVAFLLSWTAGLLVRTRRLARSSRQAADVATQEVVAEQERTRIARDMHDVVAHSLAVVVAQADGARYLGTTDPAATDAALAAIAATAREALSDVRVLLAQLRHSQDDGPQPTLVDLDRLLAQLRASGLTISQEVSGTPLPLGTAQQLAVYRIVQESLTNVLRHADTSQEATLHFEWTLHGLDLTISSRLRPQVKPARGKNSTAAVTTSGHGIAGMRERAALVGGRLTADAETEAGLFLVRAWLPERAEVSA
jgi:signal transduction histidine kinase